MGRIPEIFKYWRKYINEEQINNWKLQLTNYEMGNVNLEIHNLQSKAIDEEELLNKILVDNDKKIMSISEERDLYNLNSKIF